MTRANRRGWNPAGLSLRLAAACLLALTLGLALGAAGGEATGPDDGTPTAEPTPSPSPTPPPTATSAPSPTPSPSSTPAPAHDLAVLFFNNFCEKDQPLLVTIFNTNLIPMSERKVRIRLLGENGLIEQHDHILSLPGQSSVNLPLESTAQVPWVQVEVSFRDRPEDPNEDNDSVSCGVTDPEAPKPIVELEPTSQPVSRVAAPPASGGATSDRVWRQAAAAPTEAPQATVQAAQTVPTLVPRVAPATNNRVPQPSLTPTGDAGGGLAPAPKGLFPSRLLMLTGVVLLAAGSSWGFYYLTRPVNS